MLLKEFIREVGKVVPFSLQESYDNSGIQVGDPSMEIGKALLCLDVTPGVMEEAEKKGCNLIICHHPLIFKGLKKITGKSMVEEVVFQAIKKDIAIVALHTNLDNIAGGVNYKLASLLGLKDVKILDKQKGILRKLVTFCPNDYAEKVRNAIFTAGAGTIGEYDCCSYNVNGTGSFRAGQNADPFVGKPGEIHFEPEVRIETIFPAYLGEEVIDAMIKSHPYQEVAYDVYPLDNSFDNAGSGVYGCLDKEMEEREFLDFLKETLGSSVLKHSPFTGKKVSKVALCGGSGSFLLEKAISTAADVFITADVKYHQFFEPWPQILLVDAGHYETEQFTKELLYEVVNKKISKFALLKSEVNTNPVNYF